MPQTPAKAEVIVLPGGRGISPQDVIAAAAKGRPGGILLLEAGPKLLGQFLGERLVDELFLTIAPQIAGRDDAERRPGLVAGRTFAPDDPLWANLASARRAGDHLFLRYALPSRRGQARPHPGGVGRMIDAGQES